MARFRATIQGQRGAASRLGSSKSGISARINGWDAGLKVCGYQDSAGRDQFVVYVTGGSNCKTGDRVALTVIDTPQGPKIEFYNA